MSTLPERMIPVDHGAHACDFHAFQAAVSTSFVPLSVRADRAATFRGEINTQAAGELTFAEITANAHRVTRTPEMISGGVSHYKLSIMLSGHGLLIQDRHEMSLHPGIAAIYDTSKPYTLIFDGDFRNFTVMLPADVIALPQEFVRELSAATNLADSALGRTVTEFLLQAPRSLKLSPSSVERRVSRGAIDLLEAVMLAKLGQNGDQQDPKMLALRSVQDYVEDHLGDVDLTPDRIAAANFISVRHLHGLFQRADTTVSTYIRTRRLERCHQELTDPLFASQQVSTIARRWGFPEATHFSRAFRSHFGMSPRTLRAASMTHRS